MFRTILSALLMILLIVPSAFACQCDKLPICARYSNAKRVFWGKVVAAKRLRSTRFPVVEVRFEVAKRYKGAGKRFETMRFLDTDCRPEFTDAATFLVFDEGAKINATCDTVESAADWSNDLREVSELASDRPTVSFEGQIKGLTADELADGGLYSSPREPSLADKIDLKEYFSVRFPKFGIYTTQIILKLPDTREVQVQPLSKLSGTAEIQKNGSTVRILLQSNLKQNGCDARQIIVRSAGGSR